MNVREAATILEVSVATIYSLVASGKLRHYRIGNGRGVVRISEEHIANASAIRARGADSC